VGVHARTLPRGCSLCALLCAHVRAHGCTCTMAVCRTRLCEQACDLYACAQTSACSHTQHTVGSRWIRQVENNKLILLVRFPRRSIIELIYSSYFNRTDCSSNREVVGSRPCNSLFAFCGFVGASWNYYIFRFVDRYNYIINDSIVNLLYE